MTITRRRLLKGTGAIAASSIIPVSFGVAQQRNTFDMSFAPHEGMFKNLAGDDIVDQINFAAEQGFTSWEDNWLAQRPIAEQNRIAKALADNNMIMGVFIASDIDWENPTMSLGNPDYIAKFVADMEKSNEVAKRIGAKWATVVPGVADRRLHHDYQMANLLECLKRGSEVLEKSGLIMVLEPLNNYEDHPGLLLGETAQAYYLCKAVDSPSCKILFDIYHQQVTEGRLISNINQAWEEIAYFQIGDTPGRNEPTSGEINYRNVFKHIHNKGYRGVMGMEHGNSKPGAAGEQAVIDAYREVGNFYRKQTTAVDRQ
ncbi:MAG: TIM barrel protein [Emcibacteraceae bacterium]|nr:TIM barrel protein [Emcibacteraceae bacterium]MDG1996513.1 TIM barrel protein [Emcibacteraceae bacterium]